MISIIAKSSKAPCVSTRVISRRRNHPSILRRITRKNSCRRLRQPLAIKNAPNGALSQESVSPRLPRTLGRPQVGVVKREPIEAAYPELAQIPTEYLRKGLAMNGNHMFAAVTNVQAKASTSTLPQELEITVNDVVAAHCPTHMLAVYGSASISQKRKVTLFPAHHLIFATHCTNLPAFPASHPDATALTVQLPVVNLGLPSPETFPTLQSYLYHKRLDVLFSALIPSLPSPSSLPDMAQRLPKHLAATSDVASLEYRAMLINGVWRNACALGISDDKLWDAIIFSWEAVVAGLELLKCQRC